MIILSTQQPNKTIISENFVGKKATDKCQHRRVKLYETKIFDLSMMQKYFGTITLTTMNA